ncbi:hypothetical protein L1F30_09445 [Simiduia sp. 21SJ11W-1]|uniref:hypothetical protein n=1 Tax=Simiduia sp. 21SJ11W-1 TaxID=2909669 RepID=UPI0020A0D19A|nr:hypothetical protein [Simiduia sp. 21SJ11W-1]UTA46397.1 hypothetical protein L1F30_09445 [Simiduia sp. 21SJ11W-1]
MDFEDWVVGPDGQSAKHSSGFTITVDGNPRDPQGVNPGKFPQGLSVIDQARLLRLGVEAIARAAKQKAAPRPKPAMPKSNVDRPVLSIKRKSETKTPA